MLLPWEGSQLDAISHIRFAEAIDTTTPMGSFIFHITAALAELERSIIRERTRASLASARARGRKGAGRRNSMIASGVRSARLWTLAN
jgi:DNA invertase Pin-like site-specific DNA recombinase